MLVDSLHTFKIILLVCAIMVLIPSDGRADKGGVLFYAGFNGTATAAATGNGVPVAAPSSPVFAQGYNLQGITVGGTAGYLTYSANNNIIQDHGSLEFWFSPADWDGSARDTIFFKIDDPGWFALYKRNGDANCYFIVSENRRYFASASFHALSNVKRGEWHHLVATWNSEEYCLYLNGQPATRVKYPRYRRWPLSEFKIGGDSWLTGPAGRTVIDEFYLYDRPLNDAEVAWAYNNVATRAAGDDVPSGVRTPLHVTLRPRPSQNLINVEVTASGYSSFSGTATLTPFAGTSPAPIAMTGLHRGTASIPFTTLRARKYYVNVVATDDQGNEIGRVTKTLVSPGSPPEWRGNKIGIPATPPSPWTPVEVEGQCKRGLTDVSCISCWGRKYMLGPSGLPVQIKSQNYALMAAPVEFRARVNGAYTEWTTWPGTIIGNTPVQAQMQGMAESSLGELQWKCTIEFDGMVRYDLKLKPSSGISVDDMEIRCKLNPDIAKLFHTYQPGRVFGDTFSGALDSQQGVLRQADWAPYWWLGNEDVGLAGYCESDQAWARVDTGRGFFIERTAKSVDAVWKFIEAPAQMSEEWNFTFGLQATPVKATPGWRTWRIGPRFAELNCDLGDIAPQNTSVSILWSSPNVNPYFGYPKTNNPQLYKSTVDYVHAGGAKIIPYSIITQIASQSPEWKFYGEEWGNAFYLAGMNDIAAYNEAMLGVDPTPDWIDFAVWANDKYVRDLNLDGLYHDNTFLIATTNQTSGYGYVRDGKLRPTYPVFGTRELYKRVYCMLKDYGAETGKEMFMMSHMSTNMIIPILGFSDSYLDGELLPVVDNYLDVVSLDELRAQYMGRNYGVLPYILPEFKGDWAKKPEQTQHLMGLVLLHDMGIWPIWCMTDEVRNIFRAVDSFNVSDAEFLPYWNNDAVIAGQTSSVKSSAYRKPAGGSLICVVNTTRQLQKSSLTVDWQKLQLQTPLQLVDAMTGSPISLVNSKLELDIQPLNFRLVEVR